MSRTHILTIALLVTGVTFGHAKPAKGDGRALMPKITEVRTIIRKWDEQRKRMVETVAPVANFDAIATYEMRRRRAFQMFRVIEYLEAFDIHEEQELLKVELGRVDLPDSVIDQLRSRMSTLTEESQRSSERIKRLNADQRNGVQLRVNSKERRRQFEKVKELNWKLPLELEPQLNAT
ncbi:hypothetical protein LOC71_21140 [Rhodopirellula sp. JC740]|uniref:Uncharacterized protein n=1 Tax=Rhodopirellula halodulae TaxID=2894198 RepID=A0ABS8NPN2_9BACT|nr:hypothetical protein [Rhodopirellula sp. JC740]MCC9644788.1 hypothetical protein [Rhodopirellula sp. JC740]